MGKTRRDRKKTLADCFMSGGAKGKLFLDVDHDYNSSMESFSRSFETGQLRGPGMTKDSFPRATYQPAYEVVGFRGSLVVVNLYLGEIGGKKVEHSFNLASHLNDPVYSP